MSLQSRASRSRAAQSAKWVTKDSICERALRGLRGVVRISHTVLSGRRFLNIERFAPAADWEELSTTLVGTADRQEAAHDL